MSLATLAVRPAPRLTPARVTDPAQRGAAPRATTGQDALALEFAAPTPVRREQAPAAGAIAQGLIQAALEVVDGRRSPLTLQRAMTPAALSALVNRCSSVRGAPGTRTRPTIRRLRVTAPSPDRCECAAVVVLDGRVRALAVGLQRTDGRWVADAMELG